MALIVEDGTGVVGAESYTSLESADAYWDSRPHREEADTWYESDDHVKEGALRDATAFIDHTFGYDFIGYKFALDQSLEWPKIFGYDDDGEVVVLTDYLGRELEALPRILVNTVADLAGRILFERTPEGENASSTDVIKRLKVGPIDITYGEEGTTSTSVLSSTKPPEISQMLTSLLKSATGLHPSWLWR